MIAPKKRTAAKQLEERNDLVERFLPLVRTLAERLARTLPAWAPLDVDDLVQAGTIGLMGAAEKFEPARGFKFSTYCAPRVRGAMLDEIRASDWAPRLDRTAAAKLARAEKRAADRLGHDPSEDELAEYMRQPVAAVRKIRRAARIAAVFSLHEVKSTDELGAPITYASTVPDRRAVDPTDRIGRVEIMREVTRGMNDKERLLVVLYYFEGLTMREIGENLALSESRISQMHSAIIERTRRRLASRRHELAG